MIAIALKFWKPILFSAILAGVSWYSYNFGYDRREMIAVKQEQQYQVALQESLRKKYVFEKVFVTKYVEKRVEYETKIDQIIEDIRNVPLEQVADCRVPDDVVRLWNESLSYDAGTASGTDDVDSPIPTDSAE